MAKRKTKTKIEQLVKDIQRAEDGLKRLLNTDWVKVITLGNEIYHRNEMSYAIAVIRRRIRGRTRPEYTVSLVRFNLRQLSIIAVIPIDFEVLDILYNTIKEAWKEANKRNEEIRKEQARKRFAKMLAKMSEAEREVLLKTLPENERKAILELIKEVAKR